MLASNLFQFTDEQVSTMCVLMNGFVGFRLLYQLCKPFNVLKKALFISMITLMLLQCIFLREFYSLVWLNLKMIILLGGLMVTSLLAFRLFTDFIEWRIERKIKKKKTI